MRQHLASGAAGHRLYFYAGDSKPGPTAGQGLDQFDGVSNVRPTPPAGRERSGRRWQPDWSRSQRARGDHVGRDAG